MFYQNVIIFIYHQESILLLEMAIKDGGLMEIK